MSMIEKCVLLVMAGLVFFVGVGMMHVSLLGWKNYLATDFTTNRDGAAQVGFAKTTEARWAIGLVGCGLSSIAATVICLQFHGWAKGTTSTPKHFARRTRR